MLTPRKQKDKPANRLPTRRSTTAKRKVSAAATGTREVRIFLSYSHVDAAAQAKLQVHLAALKREGISVWSDNDMNAGAALDSNIARELGNSQIFIALLSPEYLASHYCWHIEYHRAMYRRAQGLMRVVAVVLRPCDWKRTRAARYKMLPRDGRPVTNWRTADDAYLDITAGIRDVVKAVRGEKAPAVAARAPAAKPGKIRPAAVRRKPAKVPGTQQKSVRAKKR